MEDTFKVVEIFYSVEGEGSFIGYPVVFIRLEGCNLRCDWCDTTYSYDGKTFKTLKLNEIIKEVKRYKTKKVCITGGEPFLSSNLDILLKNLYNEGYYILIESNGTLFNKKIEKALIDIYPNFYLIVSPKPEVKYQIHSEIVKYINEFKFIVDRYLTLDNILLYRRFFKLKNLVLQPESNKKEFIKKAVELQNQLLELDIESRVIPQCQKFMDLK